MECMAALLPKGVLPPHRFETVGHIAHLNLNEEHLPFKFAVGEIILDVRQRPVGVSRVRFSRRLRILFQFWVVCVSQKHAHLRTVVVKTGIGREWRQLEFELVAGVPDFKATVVRVEWQFLSCSFCTPALGGAGVAALRCMDAAQKESGLTFEIDYANVFWNSR